MQALQGSVIQRNDVTDPSTNKDDLNAAINVLVTIRDASNPAGGGVLSNTFDINGSPVSNPTTTDSNGNYLVYVIDGSYDVIANEGLTNETIEAGIIAGVDLSQDLSQAYSFNTMDDVITSSLALPIDKEVTTKGYTSTGDTGEAKYTVVPAGTGVDDKANYIDMGSVQLRKIPTLEMSIVAAGAIVDGVTSDTAAIEAAATVSDVIVINGVSRHASNIDLLPGAIKNFKLVKGRLDGFNVNGIAKFTGTYLEGTTARVIDLDDFLGESVQPPSVINSKLLYRLDSSGELNTYCVSKCPHKGHLIIQKMAKGVGAGASSDYDLFRCTQVYKSNEVFTFNSQNITVNGTNTPVTVTPSVVGDSGGVLISPSFDIFSVASSGDGFTIDLSTTSYTDRVSLAFRGTAGGATFLVTSGSFSRSYSAVSADNKPVIINVPFNDTITIEKTSGGSPVSFFGYNFSRVGDLDIFNDNDVLYLSRLGSADTYVNNSGASDYAIRPNSTNLFAGSYHGYETETVATEFFLDDMSTAISDGGFYEMLTLRTIQKTQLLSVINITSEHSFINDGGVVKSFVFDGTSECNRAFFGMATFGKRFSSVVFPPNFKIDGLPDLPDDGDSSTYAIGNCDTVLLQDLTSNDSVYSKFPKYQYNSKIGPLAIKPTADTATGYNKPYGVRLYDFVGDIGDEAFSMEIRYY